MPSRDPADLYKDKLEVSLDGRQIFYLFFGGAVVVGLVFVLGVMVGRRIEARGHLDQARTPAATDPLAALDRLEGSGRLSFQGALTGGEPKTDVERAIGEIERSRRSDAAPAAVAAPARPEAKLDAKPKAEERRPADRKIEPADKKAEPAEEHQAADRKTESADKKADPAEEHKPDKKAEGAEEHKAADKKADPADRKLDGERPKKADGERPKKADGERPKKADGDAAASDGKPRYTLQLSSFQDRREAEAFLASIKAAGYQPYLTEAEVSGKGTFYRVRLGSYRSLEAANEARSELERSANKAATVMRL